MPLALADLQGAAQIDTSKNPVLAPLWKAVTTYNATGGLGRVAAQSKRFDEFARTGSLPLTVQGDQRQRALALQDIMRHAAGFLTCKPPSKSHPTRHARWEAMRGLMADVNREATEIGVKLVDSPRDFRSITMKGKEVQHPSVWLEVIDPKHRDFSALSTHYANWLRDGKALTNRTSFWTYMGDQETDYIVRYNRSAESFVEKNKGGAFTEFHGNVIDTSSFETLQAHSSNKGWGIFAITTDKRLHVGQHSNGDSDRVRHTTLTDGDPIIAAGEICIINGKIVAISNLTGHYKLGGEQFLNWVAETNLLDSNVMVKTRFNVHGEIIEKDSNAPNGEISKKTVQPAIAAASKEKLVGWINKGKPINKEEIPFTTDSKEVSAVVGSADWSDLKNVGMDKVTKIVA